MKCYFVKMFLNGEWVFAHKFHGRFYPTATPELYPGRIAVAKAILDDVKERDESGDSPVGFKIIPIKVPDESS